MGVVGVVLVGCGRVGSAAAPLAVSTATPILSAAATTPTATSLYTIPARPDLGGGWTGSYEATGVPVGAVQTYVHFPQRHITYDEVIVDDILLGVAFVCYDRPYDVTDMFVLLTEPGEIPVRYRSRDIQQRDGCHIEFTVKNSSGGTMGLSFISHCSFCYD